MPTSEKFMRDTFCVETDESLEELKAKTLRSRGASRSKLKQRLAKAHESFGNQFESNPGKLEERYKRREEDKLTPTPFLKEMWTLSEKLGDFLKVTSKSYGNTNVDNALKKVTVSINEAIKPIKLAIKTAQNMAKK